MRFAIAIAVGMVVFAISYTAGVCAANDDHALANLLALFGGLGAGVLGMSAVRSR